eukprot:856489-Prymnesium_polylepis.1
MDAVNGRGGGWRRSMDAVNVRGGGWRRSRDAVNVRGGGWRLCGQKVCLSIPDRTTAEWGAERTSGRAADE